MRALCASSKHAFGRALGAAVLLFSVCSAPARAAYRIVSGVGTGTLTKTGQSPRTITYRHGEPGNPPIFFQSEFFGDGELAFDYSETWTFEWDSASTPEEEAWGIPVSASWGSTPSSFFTSASSNAEFEAQATGLVGAVTNPDDSSFAYTVDWTYNSVTGQMQTITTGAPTGTLVFALKGQTPTVTITAKAKIHASSSAGSATYNRLGPGRLTEWIQHGHPQEPETTRYQMNASVPVDGSWRGLNGTSYKIRQSWKPPQGDYGVFYLSNAVTSTGATASWTGTSIPVGQQAGMWVDRAELWALNGSGMLARHAHTHWRNFVVGFPSL